MNEYAQMIDSSWKRTVKGMFPGCLFILSGFCIGSFCLFFSGHVFYIEGPRAIAGFLTFTFVEYWVHRKLFHLKPNTPVRKRLQYLIHGQHHIAPQDNGFIGMTPTAAFFILLVLSLGAYYFSGYPGLFFISGFLSGYGWYLLVHFMVHHFPMPKSFLGVLWKNHHTHHYRNSSKAFGVSSPLWDYVFRTSP